MTDELDEALYECGFTINSEGIATAVGTVTVEAAPVGTFCVRITFENGKTLQTLFAWDDIEDTFPWKTFKEKDIHD